jgi:hypothetical protein
MNYELAKQLKEAGFPQNLDGNRNIAGGPMMFEVGLPDKERCYVPTLSELIEACGIQFDKLYYRPIGSNLEDGKGAWFARKMYPLDYRPLKMLDQRGSTPDEAVARLWLALNQK